MDTTEKENHYHEEGGHWNIVNHNNIPNKDRPIKSIWFFKSKCKPYEELSKHKARLCSHYGMQQWGDSHWGTYSPVVNMINVRLILAIDKIHSLDSKAIDFVLEFTQAYMEEDIWMQLTIGFQVEVQTEADSN